MIATMAVLFVISGVFVMDSPATPQDEASRRGLIHALAGGVIFLLMPVAMFTFLGGFGLDPAWRVMHTWTLALGIVEVLAVVVFILASKMQVLQERLSMWVGVIQRAALVPFMIWIFVFGIELLRHISHG